MIHYSIHEELNQRKRHKTDIYKFSGCLYKINIGLRDRNGDQITVNCGRCLYCLTKKQSKLEFFAKKELFENYRKGKGASFVTLTYSDDYAPYAVQKKIVKGEKQYNLWNLERTEGKKTVNKNYVMVRPGEIQNTKTLERVLTEGVNTLYKKDFKDFMKRFRRNMEYYKYKGSFKYIYCGEYGDNQQRSHMHMVLIGLTAEETRIFTKKAWKYGLIDIGPLGAGGIRYLIDYVTKSQTEKKMKELLDKYGVEPPFIYHSIRMGLDWMIKNAQNSLEAGWKYYGGATAKKTLMPTEAIKFMCNILNLNYQKELEKLAAEYEQIKKGEAERKGQEMGQMLWEERILKEEMMYNAIRTDGKKPISPEYLSKIKNESKATKPKSRTYRPGIGNQDMRKLINRLLYGRKSDGAIVKKMADYQYQKLWIQQVKEDYNFEQAINFFENCAKNA